MGFKKTKYINHTNYTRGLIAEIYVMGYFFLKGYRIVAWRYKTPMGEIDIIAKKRNIVVFVEVKLRPNFDSGFEAVNDKSQNRITRAASHFMASLETGLWKRAGGKPIEARFDVVAVSGFRLRHLDNAWLARS